MPAVPPPTTSTSVSAMTGVRRSGSVTKVGTAASYEMASHG
jgi:hypothetical protein